MVVGRARLGECSGGAMRGQVENVPSEHRANLAYRRASHRRRGVAIVHRLASSVVRSVVVVSSILDLLRAMVLVLGPVRHISRPPSPA